MNIQSYSTILVSRAEEACARNEKILGEMYVLGQHGKLDSLVKGFCLCHLLTLAT